MALLQAVEKLCVADGDCLLYKGRKDALGYGLISVKRKLVLVHIVIWKIFHGNPRKGWLIEHTCGRNHCCSVAHMARESVVRRIERMCIPEDGCLLFTGAIHKELGYGLTAMDGKQVATHRAVWSEYNTELSPHMRVGHTCGRRHCCSVAHMYATTRAISEVLAQRIKNTLGYGTLRNRARLFKVSVSVVSRIDNDKIWAHLPRLQSTEVSPGFLFRVAEASLFADNVLSDT